MICIDLSKVDDIKALSEFIIRANNRYDIEEMFKNGYDGNSAIVITPSQMVSAEFQYGIVDGGHKTVINSILKTIYPNYIESTNFFDSNQDVIIVTALDFVEIGIVDKINKYQYDKIIELINKIKDNTRVRIFLNNDEYKNISELINILDSIIEEKEIPLQYPIGNVLFNDTNDETEKDKLIDEYLDNYYGNERR